jgi:predicted nucleic acid-binding protein
MIEASEMVLDANVLVRLVAPSDYAEHVEALWLRVSVGGEPCGERHTYDSVYLAVARAFGMEFWTADQRLLRHLAGRFPESRFLGDYPLDPPAA